MALFFTILLGIWIIILAVIAKVNKHVYSQRLGALVLMGLVAIPFAFALASLLRGL